VSQPEVVALDFDGVLVDSGQEVLLTALASWEHLYPKSRISQSFESDGEKIGVFQDLMPLGNRAEDFGVALAAIERGTIPQNQIEYDDFRQQLGQSFLTNFHTCFYKARVMRQQEDPEAWLALHRPYWPMLKILSQRSPNCTLVLATSKDERSARLLLDAWGIGSLFPSGHIYDKERGRRKSIHLTAILRDFGVDAGAVRFIDDKVKHLSAAAEIKIRGILAGWGHNTPREHALAKEMGFPVADFGNVEELLFE